MFGLFKRSMPAVASVPHLPSGVRAYAIGDVHGRLDLLDTLLAMIDADDATRDAAETWLIFLGDYVDRGPDSAGVVDRVMRLCAASPRVRALMGNHEEILLRAATDESAAMRLLLKIGGDETILSYGITPEQLDHATIAELGSLLAATIPATHHRFLGELEDQIVLGDYAFVHAGIRPGRPFDQQEPGDLRWIRAPFLESTRDHGKVVVHGHTPMPEPVERPNRIGIDTGAWQTGRLTALGLEGPERWFLSTGLSAAP